MGRVLRSSRESTPDGVATRYCTYVGVESHALARMMGVSELTSELTGELSGLERGVVCSRCRARWSGATSAAGEHPTHHVRCGGGHDWWHA